MKKLYVILPLFLLYNLAGAQSRFQVTRDTVKVVNAELAIQNSTQNVSGFLYNKANGTTEFRKAMNKVNDSVYLIGSDSLKIINRKVANGLVLSIDTVKLGGVLTENTTISDNATHNVQFTNLNQYSAEAGISNMTPYGKIFVNEGRTYLYSQDSSANQYSGVQTDVVGNVSNSTVTRVTVYANDQTSGTYAEFGAGKISLNPRSVGTAGYIELLNIPTGGTSVKTLQIGSNNRLYANTVSTPRWAKGAASGNGTNGTTTPITIAHGLTGVTTSTSFVITPTSAAAGGYKYATIDATNVYIYYSTAPAAGTSNLTYNFLIQ